MSFSYVFSCVGQFSTFTVSVSQNTDLFRHVLSTAVNKALTLI